MVTDPVADMLAQIKNAGQVQKSHVSVPYSKHIHAIADEICEAGYLSAVEVEGKGAEKKLLIELMYEDSGNMKISGVKRISKPSRRLYYGADDVPEVKYGHGMLVLSTSKGIISDDKAREEHIGGEALFEIW